jgi:ABC-type nickel/cobalt efflux system permease component RcnA
MSRAFVAGAAAVAAVLALAAPAAAHPLGNFSVNHLDTVSISRDEVRVHYVLDQAEIPTFQERGVPARDVLARKRAGVARGVTLRVDGRPVALRLAPGGALSHPMGQGGLSTTRVELDLAAPVENPRRVEVRDATFPDRVGWRAIVVAPGRGTAVRSSVPAQDPTGGLRRYPKSLLQTPEHVRSARFAVAPGAGTVSAPRAPGVAAAGTRNRAGDGLAGVFERAAAGQGVLLLLVLSAFAWGALHALSPGHGKAMVAAYLVGTRGTARHAVALGLTVTVTHTIGVFALGLVTLALSQYILPEDLYPWLNLASGLLIVVVGVGVLRARVRRARPGSGHAHDDHDHAHHGHDHAQGDHGHAHHGHGHHHHNVPSTITARGLVAMGASAGLIPCPSALVVLLGAVAQHQVGLGLGLIVAFSAGLATTLVALGLVVVLAAGVTGRIGSARRFATIASAVSSAAIVVVGLVVTTQALPQL